MITVYSVTGIPMAVGNLQLTMIDVLTQIEAYIVNETCVSCIPTASTVALTLHMAFLMTSQGKWDFACCYSNYIPSQVNIDNILHVINELVYMIKQIIPKICELNPSS